MKKRDLIERFSLQDIIYLVISVVILLGVWRVFYELYSLKSYATYFLLPLGFIVTVALFFYTFNLGAKKPNINEMLVSKVVIIISLIYLAIRILPGIFRENAPVTSHINTTGVELLYFFSIAVIGVVLFHIYNPEYWDEKESEKVKNSPIETKKSKKGKR